MKGVLVLVVFISVLAMLWRSADGEKDTGLLSGIKDNLAKRRWDYFSILSPLSINILVPVTSVIPSFSKTLF